MNENREGRSTWIKLVLGSAALAVLYYPTFGEMARLWWNDTYSVHGMFVPLFAAHLVWTDRARLREVAGPGDPLGLAVLGAALALLLIGEASSSLVLRGSSFVVALGGMLLWLFGWGWVRAAAFPLIFLLLMVPPPHALIGAVTTDLQLFAARFSGAVLQLAGVPSYQEGTYVFLPSMTLVIAEICNGLRFLLALLVLTLAFAELALPTVSRKALLVLSVFPVAILANAARVTAVALAVHYWGPEAASGPIHHGIGKAVWILTLVPMGIIALLLRRFPTRTETFAGRKVGQLTETRT